MLLGTPLVAHQELQQDQECSCHCQKEQQLEAKGRAQAFHLTAFIGDQNPKAYKHMVANIHKVGCTDIFSVSFLMLGFTSFEGSPPERRLTWVYQGEEECQLCS